MLTKSNIEKYIDKGYVRSQTHSILPLTIYCYTNGCQYDDAWDGVTEMCRGLVIDDKDNIIARPLRKFHNWERYNELNTVPSGNFTTFEKLDGSMIQVFNYNGNWVISSKGSFESPHAVKASQILSKIGHINELDPDYNYVFELITPEHRIVVDYGNKEDLVLLAIINNKTGNEKDINDYSHLFTLPRVFDYKDSFDLYKQSIPSEEEGYVIKFDCGERMKIKGSHYLFLHKIITNCTYRDIWRLLKNNDNILTFIERLPDEWIEWFSNKVGKLIVSYKRIEGEVKRDFQHGIEQGLYKYSTSNHPMIEELVSRKEIAEYFKSCKYPSCLFNLLYNQDYSEWIWEKIYPPSEKFSNQS